MEAIFFITVIGVIFYYVLRHEKQKKIIAREQRRHGSARFANHSEISGYTQKQKNGIYIGGGEYYYAKQGHLLTVAGTRSGKGVNLIIPNLLGAGTFNGSWLIIDLKGENTAVTSHYQRSREKDVRILNPWGLLGLPSDQYNPLDLISDPNSDHLPDDASLLALMVVPSVHGKDDHWNNRARSLIAGILMHLATSNHELTLTELWRLLRLPLDEWLDFLKEMVLNDHPISGPIINGTAQEILSIMEHSEKEAAGIISTAQRWTDIFKSIHLRRSLQSSSFNINELSNGKFVIYVIIPADKLKSHSAWLRLVVTTSMKAVVRRPNKRVLFCLDEFYALSYIQEIEIALGTYAGFNITVWAILQSLVQLQEMYGKGWESFLGNSSVIHAFGLNDNTSAKYFSEMAGQLSVPSYGQGEGGSLPQNSSPRALITPDEARRLDDQMLVFINNLPVALLPKVPYYNHPVWSKRARPNPYYTGP